jgi:hypothetical protein
MTMLGARQRHDIVRMLWKDRSGRNVDRRSMSGTLFLSPAVIRPARRPAKIVPSLMHDCLMRHSAIGCAGDAERPRWANLRRGRYWVGPIVPSSPPSRCAHCGQLFKGRCSCTTWSGGAATRSWSGGKTHSARWQAIRALRLARDPYCVGLDDDLGCGQKAVEVDHLDGVDYDDNTGQGRSWLNVQMTRSLCTSCHRTRTGRQGAAAKQSRDYGT